MFAVQWEAPANVQISRFGRISDDLIIQIVDFLKGNKMTLQGGCVRGGACTPYIYNVW